MQRKNLQHITLNSEDEYQKSEVNKTFLTAEDIELI